MAKSEMGTQQDIQNMIDVWRMGCQNDVKEEYENCKKCPSRKICKQAYNQLVLIVKQHFQQQPVKVTRDFISTWSLKYPSYMESGYGLHEFLCDLLEELNIQVED